MLTKDLDGLDRRDVACLAMLALAGGTFACLLIRQTGSAFFYQAFTPEALMWACGRGFRHPLGLSPEMVDFLLHRKLPAFDCSVLSVDAPTGPPGFFFHSQLYFSWLAAGLWRVLGPTQMAIVPLAAALGAGYGTGLYMLSRMFFRRSIAALAAVGLTLSPIALGLIFVLRDYSKGPFFVWSIALLILAARSEPTRTRTLLAAVAGAVAGVGYGFRADLGIMLPLGTVFLAIALPATFLKRTAFAALYAAAFVLLASPILTLGNGGNVGSLVMQGATEPFRAFLALRPAPYGLGQAYSDELTLSGIAAAERPRTADWDEREPRPVYGFSQAYAHSTANLLEWAPNFAADFAAQALKGAGWILGFPALVAVSRGSPDPGFPLRLDVPVVQWEEPLYSILGQPWLPAVGFAGLVAWLARVAARSRREALALAFLLAGLAAYPAIQFSIRHVFHLEFVWLFALASLIAALWEWRQVMPVLPGVMATAAAAGGAAGLAYVALAHVQQQRLTREFSDLLSLPREVVLAEPEVLESGDILLRIPIPAAQLALTEGEPDSMNDRIPEVGIQNDVRTGGDRLLMALGGASCPSGPAVLRFTYDHRPRIWQPLDFSLTASAKDTIVFPAFYRATQSFAGVRIPRTHARCGAKIYRVPLTYGLPMVLTAVLPPNWRSLPLRKGLGVFSVGPAS